jgi:hypothetical protein
MGRSLKVILRECLTEVFLERIRAGTETPSFSGKTVNKVPFSRSSLTIGGFRAIDYFEDGSFYLLDVPGVRPHASYKSHIILNKCFPFSIAPATWPRSPALL